MRILIRTSKWAIWSSRIGSLALPLTVIPVLLHRERIIASETFEIIEALALALAALALALALGAFVRLWITGDRGWARAALGLGLALICLSPAAYLVSLTLRYPIVGDVSTDFADPPELVLQRASQIARPEQRQRIEAMFPNARSRTYPIDVVQIFTIVENLVAAKGWDLRAKRVPQTALDDGSVNVVASSLFGWRSEVAIRVRGTADGATVAMRSTALAAFPDFGENGNRVEAFMLALDAEVTTLMRNAPTTPGADN